MDDFILDEKIKTALENRAEDVHVDAVKIQRIQTKVYQRLEEEKGMKHNNWKRIVLAAAAICVMGSITAMAIGKATMSTSRSSRDEAVFSYEEAVSMQQGFNSRVKSAEEFSNGYKFTEAVPHYTEEQDADGNTVSKSTNMSFTYEKNGLDRVTLDGSPSTGTERSTADLAMTLENGIELQFSKLHNKFVPTDYVPTEEEEKLMEEGKLNIGYGGSEEEIQEMDSLSVIWMEDGITYMLFTFEDSLTSDEMFQMAKEVVGSR